MAFCFHELWYASLEAWVSPDASPGEARMSLEEAHVSHEEAQVSLEEARVAPAASLQTRGRVQCVLGGVHLARLLGWCCRRCRRVRRV